MPINMQKISNVDLINTKIKLHVQQVSNVILVKAKNRNICFKSLT